MRQKATLIGYIALAIILVAAGTYLARHVGSESTTVPVAEKVASAPPVATAAPAAPTGPMVELSFNIDVKTFAGTVAPGVPNEEARNVFANNTPALLDVYRKVLASGPGADDGMLVRLKVAPSGAVTSAAVRTSTKPNPALDAATVKSMMGWRFEAFKGPEVTIDYPMVLARDPGQADDIDKDLAHKVAILSPDEKPEYASTTP